MGRILNFLGKAYDGVKKVGGRIIDIAKPIVKVAGHTEGQLGMPCQI
jgi:hypothetical protein